MPYMVTFTINIPPMLVYHTWILWVWEVYTHRLSFIRLILLQPFATWTLSLGGREDSHRLSSLYTLPAHFPWGSRINVENPTLSKGRSYRSGVQHRCLLQIVNRPMELLVPIIPHLVFRVGCWIQWTHMEPYEGFHSHGGTQKMDGFRRENPTKMDDNQGYPYFRKPPYGP